MLLLDYKKICTKCEEEKSCKEFSHRILSEKRIRNIKHKNDGYFSQCRKCKTEKVQKNYYKNHKLNKEKQKQYYKQHKKERIEKIKIFREQNKEKISKQKKISYQKNKNYYILKSKKYYKNNKEKQSETSKKYISNRLQNDPIFRLLFRLRTNLKTKLRRYKIYKWNSTSKLTGCTTEQLLKHLQQTAINNGYADFNIENYSGKEYHIDHIIPCFAFNLKCNFHQKLCFNYKNLQILKATENMLKSNKLSLAA